jgi:hypothetical protein
MSHQNDIETGIQVLDALSIQGINQSEKDRIVQGIINTGTAKSKRVWKNSFLREIQAPFFLNNLLNGIKGLETPELKIRGLVKGSTAYKANFPKIQDEEITVQNYDIEVYILDNSKNPSMENVKKVIFPSIYWLNYIKKEMEKIKPPPKKAKRGNKDTFCINLSNNITINVKEKEKLIEKNLSCRTIKDLGEISQEQINLGEPTQLELLKGWSISLCYNVDNEYKKYGDSEGCGGYNYSHLIYYITFYYIGKEKVADLIFQKKVDPRYVYLESISQSYNTDLFDILYQNIVRKDINIPFLNPEGLLLYLCFIKMYSSFRESKGINLDDYRMELLKNYFGNNLIPTLFKLHQLSTYYNFCPNMIPDPFFLYNIKSELVEQMLVNYIKPSLPFGIKQKLDDLVISYFRPIMNDITIELRDKLSPLGVDVFIAGGDAFERYIPSKKIADVDLKVILTYKKRDKKILEKKLSDVQKIITFILSKHTIILNKLIYDLCASDPLIKDGFEEKIFYEDLVSKEACNVIPPGYQYNFKLCPSSASPGLFRVRSLNLIDLYGKKFKAGYNLFSIDYRKEFSVFYSENKNYEMAFRYELAILDVPIVLKEIGDWNPQESISLQPVIQNNNPFNRCLGDQTFDLSQTTLPIASRQFLLEDIAERFANPNLLLQRFYAGKIEKDIQRYNELKLQIQRNSKVFTDLNQVQGIYYSNILNFDALPGELKSYIFHYTNILLKGVIIRKDTKVKNKFSFTPVQLEDIPSLKSNQEILDIFNDNFIQHYKVKYDFLDVEDDTVSVVSSLMDDYQAFEEDDEKEEEIME